MPTCDQTGTCPPTEIPTEAPTTAPTHRPTRSPTNRPTLLPTQKPTMEPTITCFDWKIGIEFTLLQYLEVDNWRIILKKLCLKAFKDTIIFLLKEINIWNNEWCVNINIQFEFDLLTENRRLLQDKIDINIEELFIINDKLYNDFFDDYNEIKFKVEYKRILSQLIGQNNKNDIDIKDLEIEDALKINEDGSVNENMKTPNPTYAPHILETKTSGENKGILIGVLCTIFGLICCCVICTTCRLFYKYEGKNDIGGHAKQMTYEEFHSNPNTPNVNINNCDNGDFPSTHSTVEMEKKNNKKKHINKMKETDKMEMINGEEELPQIIEIYEANNNAYDENDNDIIDRKKSAFEMNLGDNTFVTNMIMDDIIQDIVSGNEQDDTDEDVIDVDMQNYVLTPQ
eukprot:302679_1